MYRHERRYRQVGGLHEGHPTSDERCRVQKSETLMLEELPEARMDWDERELAARSPEDAANDKESRPMTNPGKLYGWLHQMPVIGFNMGKYFIATAKAEEDGDSEQEHKQVVIRSFFVKTRNQQHVHVSVDGSAEFPSHDQLYRP